MKLNIPLYCNNGLMEKFFFRVKEEGKGGAVGDRILSISNLLIPIRNHPKAEPLPYIKKKKVFTLELF